VKPRATPMMGGAGGPERPPASTSGAGFTPAPRTTELSVLEAILRQVAHYAGHVGQIVFLAKHLEARAERPFPSLSIPRGQSRARWPYKGRP